MANMILNDETLSAFCLRLGTTEVSILTTSIGDYTGCSNTVR